MCRGRPPAPPPPPPARPIPPQPKSTADRIITGANRTSIDSNATTGRRTNRASTARRLGTSSLRIPLLAPSDLNYPV